LRPDVIEYVFPLGVSAIPAFHLAVDADNFVMSLRPDVPPHQVEVGVTGEQLDVNVLDIHARIEVIANRAVHKHHQICRTVARGTATEHQRNPPA
jgi:hypothetical protein